MDSKKLHKLEQLIGVVFQNKDLLLEALTHRSYLNEIPGWPHDHNERLEFLGDAVLELAVTEYLFRNYKEPEGILTAWRAALVNTLMLAAISEKFRLNNFVLLSRGEARDTGRARQTILANAVEAVIGAIYLDAGYTASKGFIDKFILTELPRILRQQLFKDAKSLFQEEAQERENITPSYKVLHQWGPDHAKQFKVGVFLGERMIAEGVGLSKQEGETAAAEAALEKLGWRRKN